LITIITTLPFALLELLLLAASFLPLLTSDFHSIVVELFCPQFHGRISLLGEM
jgi:hypothetical protein